MHPTELQLPRLVVEYLHILDMWPSKLDEILVRWVLVHIVVSVFYALELCNEAV